MPGTITPEHADTPTAEQTHEHGEHELPLRRIARAIAARRPSADILALIAQEARQLVSASTVLVALRSDGDELTVAAAAGARAAELRGTVLDPSSPVLASVEPGHTCPEAPADSAAPALSSPPLLAVPVTRDGHAIGMLAALGREAGGAFPDSDGRLFALLADQVALVQTVQEGERVTEEQEREIAVLTAAARTVTGSLDLQEVVGSVLDAACQHVPHDLAMLFLLNDERTHLFIAADRGIAEDEREVQLAASGSIATRTIGADAPLLLADARTEPELEAFVWRAGLRSALAAPLRSRTETIGLVLVASGQARAYRPADVKLLDAVAAQAGIAIANARAYEAAIRHADETAALNDLTQHVSCSLQMDRVCSFVADNVLRLLDVDKFALMLYDPRAERLVPRVCRGLDEELFRQTMPRRGEGIPGWVFEWLTPQAVADVSADARNRSCPIQQAGVMSAVCAPMSAGDETLGVLLAMSSRRRLFTVPEIELLYTIAGQTAAAITNARLYQDARAKSAEMRRYFHRIARALGSALEAQDAPQLMADLAVEVMRADRAAIYRLEQDTLRLHATSHFRSMTQPDATIASGDGLTGWVARRGKAMAVADLADDSRALAHAWIARERLTSYLGVPLKVGRRTVGVLEVLTQEPRAFSEDEVKMLARFARRARVADHLALELG